MRLFVSVEVSKEVKDEIERLQEKIPLDTGRIAINKPDNCHITLKFLGDVDDVENVTKALKEIKFKPFTLETERLGFFPDEGYKRVFWLGLKESSELKELTQNIRDKLPNYVDDHPFSAHITLARIKFLKDKEKFEEETNKLETKKLSFEVNKFNLMKSELTPEGAVYEIVEQFP